VPEIVDGPTHAEGTTMASTSEVVSAAYAIAGASTAPPTISMQGKEGAMLKRWRLIKIPKCGMRTSSGRAALKAHRANVRSQRDYRPELARRVQAES